jgi:dipeptidyl aminopeptidase/acylaminoacyl peptidase
MRRLLLFLLCLSTAAAAQAKHPFTFEDMMKLKRVGEPVPSPDGKWVAFSVVDVNLEANTKIPHIWIVPLSPADAHVGPGAPAEREIIPSQDSDRPRWSPDGKHFLFLSSNNGNPKDGGQQVWIADFDPATVTVPATHRLTSIATEADGPLWSPDGKNIVFVSNVYPECAGSLLNATPEEAAACNAKKLEEAVKSPVKAQIFTRLLYRHWNAYREGKRNHLFVVAVDGGTPRDLTPGDFDAPVFSLGGQDDYAISPDGQELCYTSNHDKDEATSTNNDLWIVPIAGGEAKNITADNPASDSTPLYSPDGKYIAYRAQKRPGYESDQFRLMLFDRDKRKATERQSRFRNWVGDFTWARDSRKIEYVEEMQGHSLTQELPLSENDEAPIGGIIGVAPKAGTLQDGPDSALENGRKPGGYEDDLAFSADGRTIYSTRVSVYAPAEIYVQSPSQGARPLTHLNDEILANVRMLPLQHFFFQGAEKALVEGFLVLPPDFDKSKKYPVKLLIHGGPQGAWGNEWSYRWNAELFAANGYVVLMINPRGSTGYGQKFIDDINGDWGGRAFEDIMKGIDYAEQHYAFIDKDRECALGASYGGYMINWILGHTDRFKCLVSHDGMFNAESAWGSTEEVWFNNWEFKGTPWTNRELYEKWSPHRYAKNFKTPTLVIHSQKDYRLDVSEGLQLFTTLQEMHVPSKMLYFPDEGHWILKPQNSRLWYKTVNDWVDQWIGNPGTNKGTKK